MGPLNYDVCTTGFSFLQFHAMRRMAIPPQRSYTRAAAQRPAGEG